MWFALGTLGQMLLLSLLLALPCGASGAQAPALPRAALPCAAPGGAHELRPGPWPARAAPAEAGAGEGCAIVRRQQRPAVAAPARIAATSASPTGERGVRVVAMTAFSLGTVIVAGVLAGFLIKRLL